MEEKMKCGHEESVYKNWADDAPHYCIVCGLGQVQKELKAANLQVEKLQAENAKLTLDMGTVKQAREMTDRAMASARTWEAQANETRKECTAALLQIDAMRGERDGEREIAQGWEKKCEQLEIQIGEEREHCAKIAEGFRVNSEFAQSYRDALCQNIAESIRERTEKRIDGGQNQHASTGLCWCSKFHDMG